MPRITRAELMEENDLLRSKLEAAQQIIAEALDYDDDEDDTDDDDDENDD